MHSVQFIFIRVGEQGNSQFKTQNGNGGWWMFDYIEKIFDEDMTCPINCLFSLYLRRWWWIPDGAGGRTAKRVNSSFAGICPGSLSVLQKKISALCPIPVRMAQWTAMINAGGKGSTSYSYLRIETPTTWADTGG